MIAYEYNFLGFTKIYASKVVVKDVRIKIIPARCTLLIGQNGAGKSTLLKMMSGLEKPDAGLVRVDGEDGSWKHYRNLLLQNILYLHQHPFMFDGSVRKNLQFAYQASKPSGKAIDEAIEWAGLQDVIDQPAKNLSGGEKQRVALARAYLRSPQVILLDEPTANLDQQSRIRTLELLQQFKQADIALVIASHDPDAFNAIQDERLQLKDGKLTNLEPRNKSSRVTDIHHYKKHSA